MNQDLAKILYAMALYAEMENQFFPARAYEKAALGVEALPENIDILYKKEGEDAFKRIPGVGKGIREKIIEYITTGKIEEYEELKKKIPVDIEGLSKIEGVGPKKIKALYEKLGIKNIDDLERAARAGNVRELAGFGEKTEQNILQGIEFVRASHGRFTLGEILPYVREIENHLRTLKEVRTLTIAGSLRRMKETIGDIDILVTSEHPERIMEAFVAFPGVVRVWGQGKTKSSVRIKRGIEFDVDLRVVPKESFGSALQYFTGSKEHNVVTRRIAIEHGLKLSEYGLFKGAKAIPTETEEAVYEKLGMQWVPPEMRENKGEIELALAKKLPELVTLKDIQGDLQTQTKWTDGGHAIEEMARAAAAHGLKYIAITDHTKRLKMMGGLDEQKIRAQWKEIEIVRKRLAKEGVDIRILKGSEVDILQDGSLDLPDEVLQELDVVGASIHSHFDLPREEQTARLIRAMENKNVDIIFHPTARLINKRRPCNLDMERIIETAKVTGTVLEINAYPDRLDLKDEYIHMCVNAGVKLAINSDAHSVEHFTLLEYGVAQARRGWATKDDIINAWPVEKMLKMLK